MNLELIGLSGRDKRIYEALLVAPEGSIRSLAEHTGINRGSVYESIKALRAVGLVTYVERGKQTRYSAKDPEVMHELINDRRRALHEMHSGVDTYIEHLALERRDNNIFHFASFYDGDEGLANILRDVLSTCRRRRINEYRVISSPKVSEYLYVNFPHFTRERVKLGVWVKVLRQGKPQPASADLAESRYLQDLSDTGSYTLIYGNKVAFVSIDAYNHLSGLIIENAGVAAMHRSLFDHTWSNVLKEEQSLTNNR